MRKTGVGEVAAAARETSLTNVFAYRATRTLPKDLLKISPNG